MKIFKVALFCACFVGLTQSILAQEANTKLNGAPTGVIGYVDPVSGNFKPLPQTSTVNPEALAAVVPTTGKLVFNFTITIASSIPTTNTIACSANAVLIDGSGIFITESAFTTASRNGTTATCTVTIPYSWTLTTASTDRINLSISVFAGNIGSVSATLLNRTHTEGLGQISVPPSGVTTTQTIKATI